MASRGRRGQKGGIFGALRSIGKAVLPALVDEGAKGIKSLLGGRAPAGTTRRRKPAGTTRRRKTVGASRGGRKPGPKRKAAPKRKPAGTTRRRTTGGALRVSGGALRVSGGRSVRGPRSRYIPITKYR